MRPKVRSDVDARSVRHCSSVPPIGPIDSSRPRRRPTWSSSISKTASRPADRASAREALATTLLDPATHDRAGESRGHRGLLAGHGRSRRTPYATVMLAKTESARGCRCARPLVRSSRYARRLGASSRSRTSRGGVNGRPHVGRRRPRRLPRRPLQSNAQDGRLSGRGDARALSGAARRRVPMTAPPSTPCTSTSPTSKDSASKRTTPPASGFCATACIHPTQVDDRPRRLSANGRGDCVGQRSDQSGRPSERGVFTFRGTDDRRTATRPRPTDTRTPLSRQPPS